MLIKITDDSGSEVSVKDVQDRIIYVQSFRKKPQVWNIKRTIIFHGPNVTKGNYNLYYRIMLTSRLLSQSYLNFSWLSAWSGSKAPQPITRLSCLNIRNRWFFFFNFYMYRNVSHIRCTIIPNSSFYPLEKGGGCRIHKWKKWINIIYFKLRFAKCNLW